MKSMKHLANKELRLPWSNKSAHGSVVYPI